MGALEYTYWLALLLPPVELTKPLLCIMGLVGFLWAAVFLRLPPCGS